ncbi:MAG: HAMP domain-containing histidine kinase [Treponema sp.]|nr:HAMP domain-containing histidine kinase [Treponema sp.]
MKIKTQFNLLILGIILLPLLAIVAQGLLMQLRQGDQTWSVPVYEDIAPLLEDNLRPMEWKAVSSYISRLRRNIDIAIFRHDMIVLYSTIDDFVPGESGVETKIMGLLTNENPRYGYIFESPLWLRESRIFMLSRIDRDAPKPPNPFIFMGRALLSIIVLILGFALIMSCFIARSITQSVLILEDATQRIASGELDLAVAVKGSNEITSLTSSLNRMRLTLKEVEQRRSRFIMGITHDLKTPLALIKGYAEAIEDGIADDPASRSHSIAIIAAKVDQLEGMIDDLIDFVRVDTGEWRQHLDKVNLSAFLLTYTKRIKDDAELLGRQVKTAVELPPELLIPIDEHLTVRALENLVNNAIRYTLPGGLIRIGACIRDNRILIEVADNGPGIDETDIPHVFETFYRGSSSRREQGLGLGLSVVKGVVDSHGWEISVESKKGAGTCFRITIPGVYQFQ